MTLGRREMLKVLAAAGLAAKAGDAVATEKKAAPALFVSHGSPMAAVEHDAYTRALARFGQAHQELRAIVVMSAHWQTKGGLLVTSSAQPETIHDFGGFPPELYRLRYPSPGDPALAQEVAQRLESAGFAVELDPARGLDHGAWVPLTHTHPAAKVPVIQVSEPWPRTPADLLQMGLALGPLRRQGVLVIGSGGVVHNLGEIDFDEHAPVAPWAAAFDGWVKERLDQFDVEGLARYATEAPDARRAHPTTEHFDPIFFALGATLEGDRLDELYQGIAYGSLGLRTFSLG